jgi:glutathione S-transferase
MTKGKMGTPVDLTEARNKLDKPLAALEESLNNVEYLVGNRFTVADLNVCTIVGIWGGRGAKLDFSKFPNIDAWQKRCQSRPACKPPKAAKTKSKL